MRLLLRIVRAGSLIGGIVVAGGLAIALLESQQLVVVAAALLVLSAVLLILLVRPAFPQKYPVVRRGLVAVSALFSLFLLVFLITESWRSASPAPPDVLLRLSVCSV